MHDIKDFNIKELEAVLKSWGQPVFRAGQIFSWIYKNGALDFDSMSNLPAGLRAQLKADFYIFGLRRIKKLQSTDGTRKFLFELKDKNLIEAVAIPAKERLTGCISTQAGCKFACGFCASGASGFKRNLEKGEIIEQALVLKNDIRDKALTHLVFMGTGEPLDNYDNVLSAVRIINSPQSLNIGARRITISTSGIIPSIKRLSEEGLQLELSVSLHAADDKTRSGFMPVNRKYPLAELIKACKEYIRKTNRQVTFEYTLIKGVNSDLQEAAKLAKILKPLNCKVNLIACNAITGLGFEPADAGQVNLFKDYLHRSGIKVTLRKPRGQDIEAACGQLRLRYENQ